MWEVSHNGQTYHVQSKIGQGCTAQVYKATSKNKQTICVKLINQDFMKHNLGKSLIQNQTNVLSQLSHPYLLKFITRKYNKSKQLMIVTQYCQGGTLYDYLQTKGKIQNQQCLGIMKQIIEGCKHMHGQGYLHRDLKPENIFFTHKDKKHVKIADFGFAVNLQDTKLISANVGSPLYMPHQSLSLKKFSTQSDVFAIGVIWYELLTGRTPFQASTERDLQQKTKKEQIRSMSLTCSQKIKDLIIRCLKAKSHERPSLSDLLTAIEEGNSCQRVKSKSVVLEKQMLKTKFVKQSDKENQGDLLNQQIPSRNQRSNTQLDSKSVKAQKVPKKQQIHKIHLDKRFNCPASALSKENLMTLLKKLSEVKLTFLPASVQEKFTSLLSLYGKLITGKNEKGSKANQDELIASLTQCQNEQDFCISSFSFLRRLLRLAKTYKQFSTTIEDLSKLWEHVQAKCLSK